ncbi:SDR family NAD(P)-dependent oxidoreductase [Neolewinella sp.]|uniref:SDR family NAD(P)-dependent oxidoreductase n=1 Tax=Neolewinella sp. TaxID=2993543 RepID=UPI003B52CF42
MPNKKWNNKVAVVTGAGGTLCSEMARQLAADGARVVLLGRTREKLESTAADIRSAGGQCAIAQADVTDEAAVRAAVETTLTAYGQVDFLINGAGGNQAAAVTTVNTYDPAELNGRDDGQTRGFFNLDMDTFCRVLEVNTMGTVIPCHAFGRVMAERGSGAIINIASMNSFRPLSRVGAYGMAKAGVANFTQWLATYLAPAGVRVNAIAPGFFLNDRSRKLLLTEEGYSPRGESIIRQTPMKRFGEAPELIGCMNWLLDDEAAGFMTGVTIPVDGGFLADSGV